MRKTRVKALKATLPTPSRAQLRRAKRAHVARRSGKPFSTNRRELARR